MSDEKSNGYEPKPVPDTKWKSLDVAAIMAEANAKNLPASLPVVQTSNVPFEQTTWTPLRSLDEIMEKSRAEQAARAAKNNEQKPSTNSSVVELVPFDVAGAMKSEQKIESNQSHVLSWKPLEVQDIMLEALKDQQRRAALQAVADGATQQSTSEEQARERIVRNMGSDEWRPIDTKATFDPSKLEQRLTKAKIDWIPIVDSKNRLVRQPGYQGYLKNYVPSHLIPRVIDFIAGTIAESSRSPVLIALDHLPGPTQEIDSFDGPMAIASRRGVETTVSGALTTNTSADRLAVNISKDGYDNKVIHFAVADGVSGVPPLPCSAMAAEMSVTIATALMTDGMSPTDPLFATTVRDKMRELSVDSGMPFEDYIRQNIEAYNFSIQMVKDGYLRPDSMISQKKYGASTLTVGSLTEKVAENGKKTATLEVCLVGDSPLTILKKGKAPITFTGSKTNSAPSSIAMYQELKDPQQVTQRIDLEEGDIILGYSDGLEALLGKDYLTILQNIIDTGTGATGEISKYVRGVIAQQDQGGLPDDLSLFEYTVGSK